MGVETLVDLLAQGDSIALDGGLATELEAARPRPLRRSLVGAAATRRSRRDRGGAPRLLPGRGAGRDHRELPGELEGFARAGIGRDEATRAPAPQRRAGPPARDRRVAELEAAAEAPPRLLVAASVGPYGAMLADGQEYEGHYGLTREELAAFHRPRLAELRRRRARPARLRDDPEPARGRGAGRRCSPSSRACAPGSPTAARTAATRARASRIEDAVARRRTLAPGVAVGVNCTRPEHVDELLARGVRRPTLPLVAYPNDGRVWDGPTAAGSASAPRASRPPGRALALARSRG